MPTFLFGAKLVGSLKHQWLLPQPPWDVTASALPLGPAFTQPLLHASTPGNSIGTSMPSNQTVTQIGVSLVVQEMQIDLSAINVVVQLYAGSATSTGALSGVSTPSTGGYICRAVGSPVTLAPTGLVFARNQPNTTCIAIAAGGTSPTILARERLMVLVLASMASAPLQGSAFMLGVTIETVPQ